MKVTWREALARALAQNPSAIVAMQEIERASGLVQEARAGWLPALSANGSTLRLDAPRRSGGIVTTPVDSWNGNLAVTLPLVAPLAWVNDVHAQDNRQVAKVSAGDVRRQLATAVGRAYLTVLLQHKQVDVVARARRRRRPTTTTPTRARRSASAPASTTRAPSRSCAPTRRS